MGKGIFITATDTEVGKTIISAAIAIGLQTKGFTVGVMKPISTGRRNDAQFLKNATHNHDPLDLINPLHFEHPLSPHLAAEREARDIEVALIIDSAKDLISRYDYLIIEGVGGILVPINKDFLVADLITELGFPIVIVARIGLGTINHTLLTVEAARKRNMNILGIVYNGLSRDNPGPSELDNPRTIEAITRVPTIAVFPKIPHISVENCQYEGLKEIAEEYINFDKFW
ncbi:MAG: dethiobiotin synthase [Thermodesulfobacteriota bacterium]|nr:dethiobiotin synthase [Thermodesulfobacteriota bacterium]